MEISNMLLLWIICSLIVMFKTYECNDNNWMGWMVLTFMLGPLVLLFRIIDQLFFMKWRNLE